MTSITYTEPGFHLANTLGGKHPLKNSVEKKDHPEIILLPPPLRGGISTNVSSNHHLMVLNPLASVSIMLTPP